MHSLPDSPPLMTALPPPRKRFGQHFLRDANILRRIVTAAEVTDRDLIVEIGPGRGALTEQLLERAAGVVAFELDRDLAGWLAERFSGAPLHLYTGDVLKANLEACIAQARADCGLLPNAPVKVVSNLPYNVSTPILEKLLVIRRTLTNIVVMLQREVAQRLAAAPGGKDYGHLSVLVQAHCEVQRLFDVPPGAFQPPPRVVSRVIRLLPRAQSLVPDTLETDFQRVVSVAFGQRRKMLGSALKPLGLTREQTFEALASAGAMPTARPETLSVEQFVQLTHFLAAQGRHAVPGDL